MDSVKKVPDHNPTLNLVTTPTFWLQPPNLKCTGCLTSDDDPGKIWPASIDTFSVFKKFVLYNQVVKKGCKITSGSFTVCVRENMWIILASYDLLSKYIIRIIKLMYDQYTARAEHSGKLSEKISIRTGVRRHCFLLPVSALYPFSIIIY